MRKELTSKRQDRETRRRVDGAQSIDPDSALVLKNVVRLMKEREMTYVDLAYKSGTHPSTMYALLYPCRSGYGPLRISTIRKMAEGLDVPIMSLLSGLRSRQRVTARIS